MLYHDETMPRPGGAARKQGRSAVKHLKVLYKGPYDGGCPWRLRLEWGDARTSTSSICYLSTAQDLLYFVGISTTRYLGCSCLTEVVGYRRPAQGDQGSPLS